MYGIIYKITNTINGKIYIGQTTKTLEERLKYHKRDSQRLDTFFYRAIKKYGWENFKAEIIDDSANTKEELDALEQYYIKKYNCFDNPNVGYNTQSGGHSFKMTKEECQRRSERAKGENNPMYGKPGTWLGKKFTEEHKKHLSESLSGKPRPSTTGSLNPAAKKIVNITTGEVFGCIKDAAEKYKVSVESIRKSAKNVDAQCCGCYWKYYDEIDNINNLELKTPEIKKGRKKVLKVDTNKIYNSISEAADDNHCARKTIRDICNGIKGNFEYKFV